MSNRVDVDSHLAMVTVFNERAQLFHSAKVELNPTTPNEEVVLVFAGGEWADADRSTLQVNIKDGGDAVILRSVQFRTIVNVEDVRAHKQQLRDRITALELELRTRKDEQTVNTTTTEAYKAALAKVMNTDRGLDVAYSETVSTFVLDPAANDRIATFLLSNVRELIKRLRAIEAAIQDVERKLGTLRSQLIACGGDEKRTVKEVAEVQIVAVKPAKLNLLLSYMVSNASWTPAYDLRVDSKKKLMGVQYNAVVRQSTKTEWDRVQLELSTAMPHVGGDPPKLTKWEISLRAPPMRNFNGHGSLPPAMMQQMMPAPAMMSQMMPAHMMTNMMPAAPPTPGGRGSGARPAASESATVSTSTTSTTFAIVGRHTIKCDNTDVKVSIIQAELPVHLRYSAVPKLDSHTYLKAKAINTTGCILLPGSVNTFADEQFIGKSRMDSTAPDEEFWTFLGVDDDVSCTRKLVHRKFADKGGFLGGKKTRVEYKYSFTAKSGKRTAEELVVWDQFPVTEDKRITVTVDTPSKDSNPPVRFETNNLNAIEWFWDLKPNATQTFDYQFHVDYPSEETVTGLGA